MMIRTLTLSLLFTATFAQAQNSGNTLFDDSFVHEIRFQFVQNNFWSILTNNYDTAPMGEVPYLRGTVTIDGEVVDSVGVRLKGFTSYFGASDKKPIKIDFNEFVPGKRYDGLRKLNLNNATGDPSMQRDIICYDLHRSMGVDAPRTAFTKVFFNGIYWGLYQLIEQVDKEFLQNNFANDKGNLFKNMGWSHFEWLGEDVEPYDEIFDLKTNRAENDWSGFIHLMDVLNNTTDSEFEQGIEEVFNVNRFLKVLAVDVATNNWDSYLEHGRNWYIYEDTLTDVFHWIPWDYNFSLSSNFFTGGGGCNLIANYAALLEGALSVPFFNASFSDAEASYLWDFGDGTTSSEENPVHNFASHGTYNVCFTVTKSFSCEETFCQIIDTNQDFNNCASVLDGTNTHSIDRNLALVLNFMPNCCDAWGESCETIYNDVATSDPNDTGFAIDQRENDGVLIERLLNVPEFYDRYLGYFCDLAHNKFTTDKYHPLLDQNKSLIISHVQLDPNYSFSLSEFENDFELIEGLVTSRSAALRLELEPMINCATSVVNIPPGDVSINEFVASNDSTSMIFDQDNEYDDWIELHNNTASDIDLSGSFLSDKGDNLGKWEFPEGTSIAADAYLIIWADEDGGQDGLHANFKLSKDGEAIYLSNPDGSIIDNITFGEQTTNLAYARNPDGVGDFVFQASTFNASNTVVNTNNILQNIQANIYPVPASDYIHIEIQDQNNGAYRIDLISTLGQYLKEDIPSLNGNARLDLSAFATGMYILNVRDELGNQTSFKFTKSD